MLKKVKGKNFLHPRRLGKCLKSKVPLPGNRPDHRTLLLIVSSRRRRFRTLEFVKPGKRACSQSVNCPQRERLSLFKTWILDVNKIKLTVATETGERFVFSELQGVK